MSLNSICCVVSSHHVAVVALLPRGLQVQRLAVSGAFHSEMMASASDALRDVLNEVEIHTPRIPVIANTTGKPYQVRPAIAKASL